jgi:hypothetical protein
MGKRAAQDRHLQSLELSRVYQKVRLVAEVQTRKRMFGATGVALGLEISI